MLIIYNINGKSDKFSLYNQSGIVTLVVLLIPPERGGILEIY
jgi:hypothetical protein